MHRPREEKPMKLNASEVTRLLREGENGKGMIGPGDAMLILDHINDLRMDYEELQSRLENSTSEYDAAQSKRFNWGRR